MIAYGSLTPWRRPLLNITICGAGWLGHPLAQHLLKRGHDIVATKRSASSVQSLISEGIKAHTFELSAPIASDTEKQLFEKRHVVLNIPGGRSSIDANAFSSAMIALIDRIYAYGAERIIFISTSSVYGDIDRTVFEHSELSPNTESGKAHALIEQHINAHYSHQSIILRLSGLVGGERHPVRFLSGRTDIKNAGQRVNLIHRQDVIAALTLILERELVNQTLHLAASDHPGRKDYYTRAADAFALPEPEFVEEASTTYGKCLDCSKTLQLLGLTLTFESVYDMLVDT